jgi:RISC-loading complex subunit TARBP2
MSGSPYFQKMSVAVGKTPVSVLQELLSRRGTTPKYELVQIEGAIHEPTFRYRVTVADVVGMYGSENNSP